MHCQGGDPHGKDIYLQFLDLKKKSGKKIHENTSIFNEKPHNGPLSHCSHFDSHENKKALASHWKQDYLCTISYLLAYTVLLKGTLTVSTKLQNSTWASILNPWNFWELSLNQVEFLDSQVGSFESNMSRKVMSLLFDWSLKK